MYLKLANEETIHYLYDQGIGNIVANYDSAEAASADIDKLTKAALKTVEFYSDDDQLLGTYTDLVFDNVEIINPDIESETTACECHIHLRTKTAVEKRLDEHDETLATHSEEITELQDVVAEM